MRLCTAILSHMSCDVASLAASAAAQSRTTAADIRATGAKSREVAARSRAVAAQSRAAVAMNHAVEAQSRKNACDGRFSESRSGVPPLPLKTTKSPFPSLRPKARVPDETRVAMKMWHSASRRAERRDAPSTPAVASASLGARVLACLPTRSAQNCTQRSSHHGSCIVRPDPLALSTYPERLPPRRAVPSTRG